jgi:hypothetical protein
MARLCQAWIDRFAGLPGWRRKRTGGTFATGDRDLQDAVALLATINLP